MSNRFSKFLRFFYVFTNFGGNLPFFTYFQNVIKSPGNPYCRKILNQSLIRDFTLCFIQSIILKRTQRSILPTPFFHTLSILHIHLCAVLCDACHYRSLSPAACVHRRWHSNGLRAIHTRRGSRITHQRKARMKRQRAMNTHWCPPLKPKQIVTWKNHVHQKRIWQS